MTDDTDDADHAQAESARSLPLIDTFAALSAELEAKEQRIERLESELAQGYLDPAADHHRDAGVVDGEPGAWESSDADATTNREAHVGDTTDGAGTETRSHDDWEPATDPLSDTGTEHSNTDHEGVTPVAETTRKKTDERVARKNSEPTDDSGLKPVRTASAGKTRSEDSDTADPSTGEPVDDGFGVTMEASTDLTGGSLGSSTDEPFVATTGEAPPDETADEPPRPDPTADRGERLSGLVRRVERHDENTVVETFVGGIEALDDVTRKMLAHYREAGDATPVEAHVAAGGSGERQYAYARNRTLRKAGVIEHDGAGRYRYALPELVAEAFDDTADSQMIVDAVADIEAESGIQ